MTALGSRRHRRTGIVGLLSAFALCSGVLFAPSSSAGELFNLDSVLALPCIPHWAVYGEPPLQETGESVSDPSPADGCPSIFNLAITSDNFAYHFDEDLQVTEIFVADFYGVRGILRHEIDAALNHEVAALPVPYAKPWLAVDLDLDGYIELVVQDGDAGGIGGNGYLRILSAPDWEVRAEFVFPGMKVYMDPIAINIDDDPFLEIYLTPNGFGPARAVLIDYDPGTGSFEKIADIPAPYGTTSQPAVGDFDGDGRMEFISGNSWGYGLFEYDGTTLSYIDWVVHDTVFGMNYSADACRPKPGGVLHALLAHSSYENGSRYQLVEPDGDNSFRVVETFQFITGGAGHQFGGTGDVDCDDLDELSIELPPAIPHAVFEWDTGAGEFVQGCSREVIPYGVFRQHEMADLNQNGAREWLVMTSRRYIHSLEDPRCDHCARPRGDRVAWWPLDEAPPDNVIDIWAGMNGSPMGDPVSEAGMVGSALHFDGQGDHVSVPDAAVFDLDTSDLTVEAWIRTTSTAPMNPLVAKYDPANDRGWIVWIADGTRPDFETSIVGGVQYPQADPQGLADGAWHHVAVTVDRDDPEGLKFYIDGALIGPGIPPGGSDNFDNTADLLIAAASPSVGDTIYFEGAIDELTIYDRVLDAYEIEDIHRVGPTGKCTNAFTACDCSHHGDVANNDKTLDVTDVVTLVDHVFRNGPRPQTDTACPHRDRGDLNCDGTDDVLDVVTLVEIAFRNSARPICNPCGCDPYPDGCR